MRFSVSIHYDQSEGVDPLSRKQEGIECSAPEEKSKAQLETLPVARLSSDDTQQKIRPIVWFFKKRKTCCWNTLCWNFSSPLFRDGKSAQITGRSAQAAGGRGCRSAQKCKWGSAYSERLLCAQLSGFFKIFYDVIGFGEKFRGKMAAILEGRLVTVPHARLTANRR